MSDMQKRVVMTLVGVTLGGFSVGLFNASLFGMDPFQVFVHGIWPASLIGFGLFYMLVNLLMLVVIFLVDKTKIGICTFINIFLLGYVVEFSSWLAFRIWPDPSLLTRIALLAVAVVVMCFGSALYYVGDLGVSTYDAIALIISEKKPWPFAVVRVVSDVICTTIGVFFGAIFGVGTVITAFFMGPLISLFRVKVAHPLRYGKASSVSTVIKTEYHYDRPPKD